jgi:hypothetical protein
MDLNPSDQELPMRTLRFLCTLACALTCVALVAATSQAAPRRHSTAHKSAHARLAAARSTHVAKRSTGATPGSAGMVIAVDPETGALRMPTTEEMQALSTPVEDDLNQSDVGLTPVHHANGMISLDLQGRFQDYAVVRVGPDGKMIFGCGTTQAGAMSDTHNPARTSGALEVK